MFVAGPFYIRTAVAAFGGVDSTLTDASRTLGAGPARTFGRVALPLALSGLGAGVALSFARGIGEFGATIMFAGSLQGVTQTLSLAVYEQFDISSTRLSRSGRSSSSSAQQFCLPSSWFPHGVARRRSFPRSPRRPPRADARGRVGDGCPRRAVRSREDRACCGRSPGYFTPSGGGLRLTGSSGSTPTRASTCRPSAARSGSSSRSTPSSLISR